MIYIVNANELDSLNLGYKGRVQSLKQQFDDSNVDNMVLTNDVGHMHKIKPRKKDFEGYKVFRTIQYKSNISVLRMLSNLIFGLSIFFYLTLKSSNKDKVIVNSIPPELLFFISLSAKLRGFELFLDGRDFWPYAFKNQRRSALISIWFKWCEVCLKYGMKSVKHVFVVSTQYESVVRSFDYKGEITFLPLGYDPQRWIVKEARLYKDYNSIYIGNENNQINLPETLEKLDGYFKKIFIVGNHKEKVNLKNTEVIYLGVLKPTEMNEYLALSDYGILPSLDNSGAGLPNKLFDYIGAGLPMVCFGDDEASKLIKYLNIGFPYESLDKSTLFDERAYEEVSKNLLINREQFSRNVLYNKYKEIVLK